MNEIILELQELNEELRICLKLISIVQQNQEKTLSKLDKITSPSPITISRGDVTGGSSIEYL